MSEVSFVNVQDKIVAYIRCVMKESTKRCV